MTRSFAERNPFTMGVVGLALTAVIVVGAMQYDKLPFFRTGNTVTAYFADAGALRPGAVVQVSGYDVGEVMGIELDGPRVLLTFTVAPHIQLGDRTEAAIKTDTLLGTKVVEVIPRGDGQLSAPIPIERTRSAYQLPDALGDVTKMIGGIDTDRLSESLDTLAQTFADTAPDLQVAVRGLTRLSETLNTRDRQLRSLLADANTATTVLAQRTDKVVTLISDTNALLGQLRSQSAALDEIALNASRLSTELSGVVTDNREQLRPALEKLNGVLAIVDEHKGRVQESIKLLNAYAMSLGESVSSGPFFKAYIANLLPGQFVQPFVDAAFSDLGLDPNVLLPSERTDPLVGQRATPALPAPYPRTGQGAQPHLTLPDAITGKPGDPRYPYREPPPAAPPGGPPPGPPAPAPPGFESVPEPTPSPVFDPGRDVHGHQSEDGSR